MERDDIVREAWAKLRERYPAMRFDESREGDEWHLCAEMLATMVAEERRKARGP